MTSLPSDFSMKIIDQEIKLEAECNLTNLNELVQLYRIAIEYYEDIKSSRF